MSGDEVWYFAYGSNLDPDRFRSRVCDWSDRRRAILRDYELRFSGDVTSEGGGGAVIQEAAGERVFGGVYRISREQIEKMDEVELGDATNPQRRGERKQLELECPDGMLTVEVYVVPEPETYRAPSPTYLGHIVKGLRAFGYDEHVIAEVEKIAADAPS
jgi:gamma-glutamylcyclotransferase (GGCT)/AIG2-like uncharacterized protein YtfP